MNSRFYEDIALLLVAPARQHKLGAERIRAEAITSRLDLFGFVRSYFHHLIATPVPEVAALYKTAFNVERFPGALDEFLAEEVLEPGHRQDLVELNRFYTWQPVCPLCRPCPDYHICDCRDAPKEYTAVKWRDEPAFDWD